MARAHRRRRAQKRRKKQGSSAASKTIGPFLSQPNETPRQPGDRTPTAVLRQHAARWHHGAHEFRNTCSIPPLREQHQNPKF